MGILFEQREKAFEAQWAREEETRFRLIARRNELVARWAASQLGLEGAEMTRYVQEAVGEGLRRKDSLFSKIRGDLRAGNALSSDLAILRKMDECLKVACAELGLA